MRCPKCESANTLEILLLGSGNWVCAVPAVQEKKLLPKTSKIKAAACTKCGHIFDFKLTEPEKFAPFVGVTGN